MKIKMIYLTWIFLALASLAWAFVALFAWTIQSDEADRTLHLQAIQESESKEATAIRFRSITQDTIEERAALESIFHADVISVVNLIETTGTAAGAKITVSNVVPESVPPTPAAGNAGVVATGFVIEAEGRFSALMHVLQLFETLPVPSTIGRVDMEFVPTPGSSVAGDWHMNVYIRVLATEEVSL